MTLTEPELARIRAQIGVTQEKLEAAPSSAGVIPIVIKCRWSSCRNGRHALDHHHTGGRGINYPVGHCQECGERITDLPMPGEDIPYDDEVFLASFAKFPNELIRAHYWNVPLDLAAYNQALRLGRTKLHAKVRKHVLASMLIDDAFANRRAPWNGHIVAYAQHATATCCRLCASYWHGLPRDMSIRPTDGQLDYVVRLAQAYFDLRLPGLPDEPTRGVPSISSGAGPTPAEALALEDNLILTFQNGHDPAGLVLPARSAVRLINGSTAEGGYVTPSLIPLTQPA